MENNPSTSVNNTSNNSNNNTSTTSSNNNKIWFQLISDIHLEFYEEINSSNMTIYNTPYDCCTCLDTVWLPSRTRFKEQTISTVKGNGTALVQYRSVQRTLGNVKEDILVMGSLFLPMKSSQVFHQLMESYLSVQQHKTKNTT